METKCLEGVNVLSGGAKDLDKQVSTGKCWWGSWASSLVCNFNIKILGHDKSPCFWIRSFIFFPYQNCNKVTLRRLAAFFVSLFLPAWQWLHTFAVWRMLGRCVPWSLLASPMPGPYGSLEHSIVNLLKAVCIGLWMSVVGWQTKSWFKWKALRHLRHLRPWLTVTHCDLQYFALQCKYARSPQGSPRASTTYVSPLSLFALCATANIMVEETRLHRCTSWLWVTCSLPHSLRYASVWTHTRTQYTLNVLVRCQCW